MKEHCEQEEKQGVNSCSICCELENFDYFYSFSWILIEVLTQEEKDMADDTKQDTSGFWTLLVIAEVMLDHIYTKECMS